MTQPETITLYTLEDAQKIIIHNLLARVKKALKTIISTALIIALGIAVMCFIEGTIGIFIIVIGLGVVYGF